MWKLIIIRGAPTSKKTPPQIPKVDFSKVCQKVPKCQSGTKLGRMIPDQILLKLQNETFVLD